MYIDTSILSISSSDAQRPCSKKCEISPLHHNGCLKIDGNFKYSFEYFSHFKSENCKINALIITFEVIYSLLTVKQFAISRDVIFNWILSSYVCYVHVLIVRKSTSFILLVSMLVRIGQKPTCGNAL